MAAFIAVLAAMLLMTARPAEAKPASFRYEYGVFLGANTDDIPRMEAYHIIVVDAMYFSKKQIRQLKRRGHVVYSYLNIGSLETFRSYFEEFEPYTLDPYAHWYDEYWMDVSKKKWQDRIIKEAAKLKKKGVDGLFVDNTDVYYYYHTDAIYRGLTVMLKAFQKQGHYVFLNSGDNYVKEYLRHHKKLDIIDGVNEETVFSKIHWDEGTFGTNGAEEKRFFQDYCALVQKNGGDVYLLEYTSDKSLKKKIKKYCKKKGYRYYITDNLDLDVAD